MKLSSVSSLTFYVKDLKKTRKFYESLGFRPGAGDEGYATFYLNWFSLMFIAQAAEDKPEFKKEALAEPKGSGLFVYIKVENVDEFYKGVLDKNLKPSSQPRDWPWGNREFVMRDPDGYKLVFFNKLK